MKKKITLFLAGLLISVSAWIVITVLQHEILKDVSTTEVYIANAEIPAGVSLNETNLGKYVKKVEIKTSLAVSNTINDVAYLLKKSSTRTILPGEILYQDNFESIDDMLESFSEPIELSLSIASQSDSVAGTIRKGDHVNFYVLTNDEFRPVLVDVIIKEAYDSSNKLIEKTDSTSIAVTFTLFVEKSNAKEILDSISNKKIVAVKLY